MSFADPVYTARMDDRQRAWFYAEYQHARRDEVIGVLLALFLGCFGVHHFYLSRNGLGILYLCFFWTGIPTLAGLVEAFFMPGRVREYNAQQADYIARHILASAYAYAPPSSTPTPCAACGGPVEPMAAFCPHCGHATSNPIHAEQAEVGTV
ncbi:TM2 domain-containing protein [Edaphobacter bradus]|uniref:TM2 domain-containing protein n=1 Tax=Edaphobacter bradus TaxID=2259016 RepID=UPI0021DF4241|nr:NINE protein [Edaphobacter bradus]